MATIDELMAGKQPGEIKVRRLQWGAGRWFKPYFKDREGFWWGLDDILNNVGFHVADANDWQLYTEPKPKVVRYLWANHQGYTATRLMTPEQADKLNLPIRLDWSATEFEE